MSIISFSSKVLYNTNNIMLIFNCLFSSYYFLLWFKAYIFNGICAYVNVCNSLERVLTGSSPLWHQQEVQKVQPCSLCWLIRFLRSAWPPPTSQYSELHKLLLCSACSSHVRCDYFTLGAASTPRWFAPATGRRHKQTSVVDASGGERRNAERVRRFARDYPLAVRWCVCKLFVCW